VKASIGVYGQFVHWAMVVDASNAVTHYVDGELTTLPMDQATYCGRSTGSLVLGHDQDNVGGALDANQAPNVVFDAIRVHNVSLTADNITAIKNGASPGDDLYSSWCFSDPSNFGLDSGLTGQNFELFGGGVASGLGNCGVAPPRITGPIAFHLPGGTVSQMAVATNFSFPSGAFTVEGFIKVAEGSAGRFMFSYNVRSPHH
jgi:hypothetical protein